MKAISHVLRKSGSHAPDELLTLYVKANIDRSTTKKQFSKNIFSSPQPFQAPNLQEHPNYSEWSPPWHFKAFRALVRTLSYKPYQQESNLIYVWHCLAYVSGISSDISPDILSDIWGCVKMWVSESEWEWMKVKVKEVRVNESERSKSEWKRESVRVRVSESKNEWKWKRVSESGSEWVSGWVAGWVGEWVSGWVGEWVSGWVGEWVSGWVGGWVGEWVSEWVREWESGGEWVRVWVSESVS